ncbi:MAG: DUF1329 domain-containing protein [Syntrophobacteraceae bacterium]
MVQYQYLDTKKNDEIFIYVPTLRRILRGEAGQRSTPSQGSIQSLDDFYMFDGKITDFKYEFVGKQKVLGVADSKFSIADAKKLFAAGDETPYPHDYWEVRDVYVFDIIAKDPTYPQGRKRIYMDPENYSNYYADVWDRAGKLWKAWFANYCKALNTKGEPIAGTIAENFGADVQFGFATGSPADNKINGFPFTGADFQPSTLLKMVK